MNNLEQAPMRDPRGFTLVEIIVTIVVAGVLMAIFAQFMGSSMTRSADPVLMVNSGFALNGVLEDITAAYKAELENGTLDLTAFKNSLAGFERNGVTITTAAFIDFDASGNEISCGGGCNLLKVTAGVDEQSATVLFSQ